jgi:hypothetical protein
MLATERWKAELILIDDTGHWGHGVIDNLLTAGYNPVGVQFHAPANDKRYKNRRAEMWILMAEWIKRGGSLPEIPEMVAELTTPTYTFSNGQFLLEDKDMIKQRLGRSPDLGDALALTFSLPEMPTEQGEYGLLTRGKKREKDGSALHEYDPLGESRFVA